MNKSELVKWLEGEYQTWEALLDEIGTSRLEQPGVNGDWSMKDVIAHLTGWNRHLVNRLEAAGRDRTEPPAPWPAHVHSEDEINAWIYESNRERPLNNVLEDTRQNFQQLLSAIEGLPEEARIETIQGSSGREYYRVWIGGQGFPVGEFFDHFQDDHVPDVRAWLSREKNPE